MDCLFCAIVAGDIPSTKIYEDDLTFAFMDIAPASEGHCIVVPKAHSRDILEIEPADLHAVLDTGQRVAQRVTDVLAAEGINLLNNRGAAAGQSVFHFHLHVIPRYASDAARAAMPLPPMGIPGDLDAIAATGARLAL